MTLALPHAFRLGVMVMACEAACSKPTAKAVDALAQLRDIQGTVSLERGGAVQPAAVPASLFSGDVVNTGSDGTATLVLRDGQTVTLSPGSRFRLGDPPGALTLFLEEGRLVTQTQTLPHRRGAVPVFVQTPEGPTQILHGTELQFDVGQGQSTLTVLFGETNVLTPDGGSARVLAGETLDLRLGQIRTRAEPLDLYLSAERGKPRWKKSTEEAFAPLSEARVPFVRGSAFQATQGAIATVTGEGVSLSFQEAPRVELTDAQKSKRLVAYQLRADKALVHWNHPNQLPAKLTAQVQSKTFEWTTQVPTSAQLSLSEVSPTVDVRTGELSWTVNGTTHVLKAGQRGTLDGGQLKIETGAHPELSLPFGKKVKVYTDAVTEVALGLPPGEDARTVEVASDPHFEHLLLSGQTAQAFVVMPLPARGALYWRIAGQAPGEAHFEPDNGRSAMGGSSPVAEVAESGLKATVIFQSAVPAITFTFPAKEGAARHQVKVFRDTDLRNPLVDRSVSELQLRLPAGALQEGNYVWYASGLTARGAPLPGGRMNKLSIIYDNSRKTLAILEPRLGARVRTKDLTTSGVAPLGSVLTVNGKNAALDLRLTLPRTPLLVYKLTSREGDDAYWIRQVRP